MGVGGHLADFGGLTVYAWHPGEALDDPGGTAVRLSLSWEELDRGKTWLGLLAALLETPGVERLAGLVVGAADWDGSLGGEGNIEHMVEALVAARTQLLGLTAMFMGDLTSEESEISWIDHLDYGMVLAAYPQLTAFGVRGCGGLRFGPAQFRHANLRQLTIESGGLDRRVVQQVLAADLPRLTELELWLGTPIYNGRATIEDLAPLLGPTPQFPNLTRLRLRNAQIADDIAIAIADAPILDQLEVLDLSLGTLGDRGAAALLASPRVSKLRLLDLSHHYCSHAMVERLVERFSAVGTRVDLSDRHTVFDEERRYVSVSE